MTTDESRVARATSVTIPGRDPQLVQIEARVAVSASRGQLADAKERIRAAIRNSGLSWPEPPLTFAVHPATDVTPACDLALACAALAVAEVVPRGRLERTAMVGELMLDGRIEPVDTALPAVLAARQAGLRRVIVPSEAANEIPLVPGVQVLGAERLADVAAWLRGDDERLTVPPSIEAPPGPDLADVVGQPEGAHSLEVAAAGGHHVLLIGVPGAGATLLAHCLPSLLPPLSAEQAIEVAAIDAQSRARTRRRVLADEPPFVCPHHTASLPSLVGGGGAFPRPGSVTLGHHGVLFLEEAAEFRGSHLEAVRSALELGEVRLARRDGVVEFPSRFQLVLATSPCPCREPEATCRCSPGARRRYLARVSGPLLDRIDLRVRLRPLHASDTAGEASAIVRERARQARERADARWGQAHTNATVPEDVLVSSAFRLPSATTAPIDEALAVGTRTKRGTLRALRVAWTLADLAGLERPGASEVTAALAFRDRRPNDPDHA